MKKVSLCWFVAIILGAALIFVGCEDPANGSNGEPGAIYLSGSVTTEGINAALASGAPVVFAGVRQSDLGIVDIEANRGVKLVGQAAYTPNLGGALLLRNEFSVTGEGQINGTSGVVIGPEDVRSKVSGTLIILQESGPITFTNDKAAVLGNVTVGTGEGAFPIADLASHTLYVIGDLTINGVITGTPDFYVLGNATVSVAQTTAVDLNVQETLTISTFNPTHGGDIIAGKLDVTGSVTFAANIIAAEELKTEVGLVSFGSANVIVSGPATLRGPVSFGGSTAFGGDVTLATTSVITLTSTDPFTLLVNKTIKVDSDVVLTAGTVNTVLTPVANATLTATAKKLTLGGADLTLTSGTLVVAADAEFNLGKAFTVAAGSELKSDGTINVAITDGSLVLVGATSTGAKIDGTVKAGAATITGIWQAVDTSASETVTITAASAVASSITSSASSVIFTAGTGGTITQAADTANNLTIGTDTTVALGGAGAKLGEIVLKNSSESTATNNGKLTLLGEITTGNPSASPAVAAVKLSTDSTTEAKATNAYEKIGVQYLVGDGTNAKVEPTNAATSNTQSAAGKIVKLSGGTTSATITGGDATANGPDGTISGATETIADTTT